MNLRFRSFYLPRRRAGLLLASLAALAGCRHESVVPVPVVDYFPVVVGTYRTYAVADSSWAAAAVTVSNYQFRERVTEQFTDAAGQPAYRLVRSKRLTSAAAWVDDSVLVVQLQQRAVLLTRNNVRTVELIYPARAGKGWSATAFTTSAFSPDTITNITRAYLPAVGTAYTTPAVAGQPAQTYAATVGTYDVFTANDNDGNRRKSGNIQVYAQGVGRVLRRRYSYYYYYTNSNGSETLTRDVVQKGASHRETLIETGTI